MSATATGQSAVRAVATALRSMEKIAARCGDPPERLRDIYVLSELIYLRLHAIHAGLAEAFYAEMTPEEAPPPPPE